MTADLHDARWITHAAWTRAEPPLTPPTLRTRWRLDADLVSARAVIAAVGVWSAHLGGRAVSPAVLEPGVTEFRKRVAVAEYDVTALVGAGSNEFVIELGEGPAHVREPAGRYTKFADRRVAPRARVALIAEYPDRTERMLSDETWQAMLGPSLLTHWYGGEDYDARREPAGWLTSAGTADDVWDAAVTVPDGPEPWRRQSPPAVVAERIDPDRTERRDGVVSFDAGRNLAGRAVMRVGASVPAGTRLELWPAEYLDDDGRVDQSTTGAPIWDAFIAAGRESTFMPRFGYHGFRHVELRAYDEAGAPIDAARLDASVVVERIQTADRELGAFTVSDPVLAGIYDLVTHAAQSNLVGVPTDCPHREKLGWLEQDHLVFEPLAFRWDIRDHFADLVTHMSDAQTEAGLIPDIAPELVVFDFLGEPGYRDDVNWGSAIWQVPFHIHRSYDDLGAARAALPAARRYVDYLEGLAGGGLLDHGLSDWIALDLTVPRALVASYGFRAMLDAAAELEAAAGDAEHAGRYAARRDELGLQLRAAYVGREADGSLRLASGSQGSIALLIDTGILDAEETVAARAALVARIAADGEHLTAGEIALPAFVRALADAGEHELLYRLVTDLDAPSYGRMLADGETALCEHWTGRATNGSGNHFMLGYISDWLTGSVAGLAQAPDSRGWRHARFRPAFLASTDHAAASYDSVRGRFRIAWSRTAADRIDVELEIPAGATAEFWDADGPGASLAGGIHRLALAPHPTRPALWRTR